MAKIDRIKEKDRRARRLAKQQQEAAELAQREDIVAEEENPLEESNPADLRKDYGMAQPMGMMDMYMPGATSFEELDAERKAQDQADEIREVTYDVQDLVRNILHDPTLDPKGKATKMQDVAAGFEERVTEALAEDMNKSAEAWQCEALLATSDRNTSLLDKGKEKLVEIGKAVLSSARRNALADSDFALVYTDGAGKKIRKYPIHDKAHVRNALARAAQQDDEDAHKAMPKIRAAAKKFGIEIGKSAILIEKDAKGDWRWIGRPTNNFIDLQTDIISKNAHEKYIAWLDANPEQAPVFLTWHLPGTAREHPVDFWMEQDGAVIMSGVLNETEAKALFKAQTQTDLGMSFQGIGLRLDKDPRVISDYWMYEVSDLPLDKAANPFTALETMIKEVGMDKLQYLTTIMGSEEKAKAYLSKTGQMQKELQDAGITSKATEEPATPAPAAPVQPAAPQVDELIEQLAKALEGRFDFEGLNAFVAQAQEDHKKVTTMEELVKSLLTSKEDDLAEALTPPASRFAWAKTNRPSQSDKTKLSKSADGEPEENEDKLLSKATPGVPEDYWLSQVTGTAPITENA